MAKIEFEQKLQQMNTGALIDFALSTEDFRLFAAKFDALAEVAGRCKKYGEMGIRPNLVLTVFQKKAALLKDADTIKAVEKLKEPSAPIYHRYSGKFETDETWIAEEELIQWSLACLRAPLPPEAFERYMDLGVQILGVDMREATCT